MDRSRVGEAGKGCKTGSHIIYKFKNGRQVPVVLPAIDQIAAIGDGWIVASGIGHVIDCGLGPIPIFIISTESTAPGFQ
jgi:hypothetical protein